jgi:DNA polymerase delta subunit 3
VHVNLAKQMLYEFHRKQNAKKPQSVHATYLLCGTSKTRTSSQANGGHSQDDGDTVMQSSPPIPGSSPPRNTQDDDEAAIRVRKMLLAREEHLEQAKAIFEHITSIHIYSLQHGGLSDLQTLSDCNRSIAGTYASEDPILAWKQYGTIQDPHVRRRTQKRQPPAPVIPAKAAPAKVAAPAKPVAASTKPTILEKQTSKASDTSQTSAKATSEPQASTETSKKTAAGNKAVPTNKRQNSDIFKSFAKGANKPKKTPESSKAPSPAPPADDEPMGGMSDDEAGDGEDAAAVEAKQASGKLRKDRQAELEAMMDAEDDEPMEDLEEPAPESAQVVPSPPVEEQKETLTVENGRRRGRRRVMKKKTVKDEEGYLGTFALFLCPLTDVQVVLAAVETYFSLQPLRRLVRGLCTDILDRSNPRRSRLGVLFRRRTGAQKSQASSCICCACEEGREEGCTDRPGRDHGVFWEEVSDEPLCRQELLEKLV